MAKINWDYEKTTPTQRLLLIFPLTIPVGVISLIVGLSIYDWFHPSFWAFAFVFFVLIDIEAQLWNKYSPWAPSEDNENE